jgi:hypothetical protein
MIQTARNLWQENRAGLAGSVLLHLLVLAICLWWGMAHPVQRQPPLKAMLVDLVTAPAPLQSGSPGRAAAPLHAPVPVETAPKVQGVRPKAITPPPDETEARIAALAQLRAPDTGLPAPDNGTGGGTGSGGYTLADFIRAQILRRWWPVLETSAARAMPVAIRLDMSRSGAISNVRILDQVRFVNDKQFHDMALSARNAALLASPIPLPPGHHKAVSDITITLDPRAVLR